MMWGESDASVAAQAGMDLSMTRGSGMRLITGSFVCSDDEYIGIHTGAVGAFGRLMQVLELDDRIPPSETGIDMGTPLTPEQAELLERELHPRFASQPRAYRVERSMAADVCAVEHLHPSEVFDEPQPRHNRMVTEVDDPVLGRVEQVAPAIRFDGTFPRCRGPAPTPGQHTDEILGELESSAVPTPTAPVGPADERPLLHDVKILDAGAYYAGPYSSRLLADLGADVIKLEPTLGDPLRGIERPLFSAQAGKRSLAVNLKDPGCSPRSSGCSTGPTSCTTTCGPAPPSGWAWESSRSVPRIPTSSTCTRPVGDRAVRTCCGRASRRCSPVTSVRPTRWPARSTSRCRRRATKTRATACSARSQCSSRSSLGARPVRRCRVRTHR